MDAILRSRAEELATEFAHQATTVEELNGLLRLMMKSGLERMLDTEMDVHLGRRAVGAATEAAVAVPPAESPARDGQRSPNRRNGRSKKTVQGDMGEVRLSTPRDRDGTFQPQLIGKHQRRVPGFDEKILALYAKGMTTRAPLPGKHGRRSCGSCMAWTSLRRWCRRSPPTWTRK
jgi:putative transposase